MNLSCKYAGTRECNSPYLPDLWKKLCYSNRASFFRYFRTISPGPGKNERCRPRKDRRAYRQSLPKLFWLFAFFLLTSVGDIALVFSLFWIFGLRVGLGEIVMVMFIHQTFYRDRKSPYLIFLAIAILFAVADFKISLAATKLLAFNPCNWMWLIVISYQSYQLIKADETVEDCIKARYKLVIAYSFVALITPMLTVMGITSHFLHFCPPFWTAWPSDLWFLDR